MQFSKERSIKTHWWPKKLTVYKYGNFVRNVEISPEMERSVIKILSQEFTNYRIIRFESE